MVFNKGIAFFLLLFLVSCSGTSEHSEKQSDPGPSRQTSVEQKGDASSKKTIPDPSNETIQKEKVLEPTLTYVEKNGTVEFVFTVKNLTEHLLNYHFPTTKRYDYIIKNREGTFYKQFSKEQSFIKLPSTEPLKPHASFYYKETIGPLPKGSYTATFILTAKEAQPKATITFMIK